MGKPVTIGHNKYKSLDTFEIKGRGTVYVIAAKEKIFRKDNSLLGSFIYIDGKHFEVKGIEFQRDYIDKDAPVAVLVKRAGNHILNYK